MSDTGKWDPKDPDEIKDYKFDWTEVLDGDTIATSTWSVVSGIGLVITAPPATKTNTDTTVWASAGTIGEKYFLLNRVTTAGGRTYDRTRKLTMKTL